MKARGRPRHPPDADDFARLYASLDVYDQAVRRIIHPHLSDPMVIPVRITTDLWHAADLPADHVYDPMASIRTSVSRAADETRKATALWPKARQDVARWSPASALGDGLLAVLPQSRQEAVLSKLPGHSVPEKIDRLVQDGRTDSVLAAMTQSELELLLERLDEGENTRRPTGGLRPAVLAALGLRSVAEPGLSIDVQAGAAQALERKIKDNDFDVFMAHHSVDKPAVLRICEFLRRQGIYPWVDVEQIPPGTWFQDVIESALLKVRTAAVFFGPDGIGRWQRLEIRTVLELCVMRAIPVIPVLLPGVPEIPDQLPFMRGLHHVAFENTLFEEAPLRQLAWGITANGPG
jgi:TIR domain